MNPVLSLFHSPLSPSSARAGRSRSLAWCQWGSRSRFIPADAKKDSVTGFVRRLEPAELEIAFRSLPAPQVHDSQVFGAPDGRVNFHGLGTACHEAFCAYVHGEWVAPELYPFVRTLRGCLGRLGVDEFFTAWSHRRSYQTWKGETDANLVGGPKPFGVLELKVVGQDPGLGFTDDICQLSCYCRLAVESGRPLDQQYAVLAYIMPRHHQVRLLVWTDVAPLVAPLCALAT